MITVEGIEQLKEQFDSNDGKFFAIPKEGYELIETGMLGR